MQQVFGGKRIFYGWFILAAGFFAMFVSTGARNGFGVFIVPMEADQIWSNRAAISAVIGLGTLVNAITQPFLGGLYDKYGGRAVISASLLLLGAGTLTLTFVGSYGPEFSINVLGLFELTNSLLFLLIIYSVVMSTATSGVSFVTVHSMLSKWFYRKRGMVLSLATAGASAGGLILTPFASFLILSSHWRVAWIALGAFVLLLALPIVLIIMRDTPEQVGEVPDGGEGDDTAGATRRSGPRQAAPGQRTPLETTVWQDSLRVPSILAALRGILRLRRHHHHHIRPLCSIRH